MLSSMAAQNPMMGAMLQNPELMRMSMQMMMGMAGQGQPQGQGAAAAANPFACVWFLCIQSSKISNRQNTQCGLFLCFKILWFLVSFVEHIRIIGL
jgi:hypothetical protein